MESNLVDLAAYREKQRGRLCVSTGGLAVQTTDLTIQGYSYQDAAGYLMVLLQSGIVISPDVKYIKLEVIPRPPASVSVPTKTEEALYLVKGKNKTWWGMRWFYHLRRWLRIKHAPTGAGTSYTGG